MLPQVVPRETAEFVVATFTGVQLVPEAINRRADLRGLVTVMWRHILPSVARPAAVSRLRPEGATDAAAATARDEDRDEDRDEADIEVGAVTG